MIELYQRDKSQREQQIQITLSADQGIGKNPILDKVIFSI